MSQSDTLQNAYVILGMHRSGTSVLAGVLHYFGANLPKTPMPPTDYNPKGYFESTPVKLLNDRILESAGSSWDDWTAVSPNWLNGSDAAVFKDEAIATLTAEFGESSLFVFKDPRNCRLWPFWRDVLAEMGVAPLPIIMLRDPEEVAASLLTRDKLPLAVGRLIWLRHVLDAERDTRGTPRIVTDFDSVLNDRESLISKVEALAGFSLPLLTVDAEAEVTAFIDPCLRRTCEPKVSIERSEDDLFQEAFQILRGMTRGESKAAYRRLDKITQQLNDLSKLICSLASPARDLAQDLHNMTIQHDILQIHHNELVLSRDGLKGRLDTNEKQLKTTERTLHDIRVETGRLAESLGATMGRLESTVHQRDFAIAENSSLRETLESAKNESAKKQDLLSEALKTRDWALGDAKAARAEICRQHAELAKMTRLAHRREEELVQKAKVAASAELARVDQKYRESTSWKVTAPLRWFRQLI